MFNSVRITVNYKLVVCYHDQRNERKERGKVDNMRPTASLNLACHPMTGNVGQCVHVPF